MINNLVKAIMVTAVIGIALITTTYVAGATEALAPDDVPVAIPLTPQEYAQQRVTEEWGPEHWEAFNQIINKESSWVHNEEHNPALSSAYGLCGFLNATWSTVGYEKTSDMFIQVDACIAYTHQRYKTPTAGIVFHNSNNWW